ncbi:MAG: hypothetical protein CEE38_22010 [Planctomycetes bacterium B3_Pla]|nr:MAG: hypothetical protein CEE38_22010 [Planctomycetes bacterium B3_Pla]
MLKLFMENDMVNKLILARHETFHPRHGWLKKGFDYVKKDNDVFRRDDAAVVLGVGKNMIRAMKYWCTAFKVIQEKLEAPKNRTRPLIPTELGEALLSDKGWDPYLEDHASLWLLHWELLKKPNLATAWYFTFNEFHLSEFTAAHLHEALVEYISKTFSDITITESSTKKDVNTIFRMYGKRSISKSKVIDEENINCPFAELGLIEKIENSSYYTFKVGMKKGLAPSIIVATCLEFASSIEAGARTITFSRLLYEQGSPGVIFKLSEKDLYEAIEKLAMVYDDIALSDSAGITQLSYFPDPLKVSRKLLSDYYAQTKKN